VEEVVGGDQLDAVERLAACVEERGHTLLALSYLAARPPVASVVVGATRSNQVRANAAATGAWALTASELQDVRRLAGG